MKAINVARAALMEIGADPMLVTEVIDEQMPGRVTLIAPFPASSLEARSQLLGLMGEHGPEYLVRCVSCRIRVRPPCTPVRLVLAGRGCS